MVEALPNWPTHFRELKKKLGYEANGRAFGKGVRFMPESDDILTSRRRLESLWFSYSLPAERSLKVAIRGLPSNTDSAEFKQELRELRDTCPNTCVLFEHVKVAQAAYFTFNYSAHRD